MPRRFMVAPWTSERRVGSSRRSSFGDRERGKMDRLIPNCEGVGLVADELIRDTESLIIRRSQSSTPRF